jgi:ATPase subunit of ABC transporter with duplicated ATPase domains
LALPQERIVYIPQEISADQAVAIVKGVRQLHKEQLGMFMTIISSLGSDPQRLLETDLPSPGEMRKLMLALGVVHCPYLIIMDEPTNHLDLPAIETLERTLDSCDCALVLVSHDPVFLKALVNIHWAIKKIESAPGEQMTQLVIC